MKAHILCKLTLGWIGQTLPTVPTPPPHSLCSAAAITTKPLLHVQSVGDKS